MKKLDSFYLHIIPSIYNKRDWVHMLVSPELLSDKRFKRFVKALKKAYKEEFIK